MANGNPLQIKRALEELTSAEATFARAEREIRRNQRSASRPDFHAQRHYSETLGRLNHAEATLRALMRYRGEIQLLVYIFHNPETGEFTTGSERKSFDLPWEFMGDRTVSHPMPRERLKQTAGELVAAWEESRKDSPMAALGAI